jgi:hypothetical protein
MRELSKHEPVTCISGKARDINKAETEHSTNPEPADAIRSDVKAKHICISQSLLLKSYARWLELGTCVASLHQAVASQ